MTEKEKAGIVRRLHRISGQIAGIEKMVGDGAPEEEILIQINAVKQASHRVGQLLLQSRVNECIHAVAEGKGDGILFPDVGRRYRRKQAASRAGKTRCKIKTEVPMERAVRFLFCPDFLNGEAKRHSGDMRPLYTLADKQHCSPKYPN